MSTANFCHHEFFDLYACDDEQCEFLNDSDLANAIEYATKKLNREPLFFEFSLHGGYYSGAQIKIDENYFCRQYGNPYDLDNDGCKLQWDLCKSRAIKKYESEKKWINSKFLPMLADYLGMRKLLVRGVFSNGEAIYQWAK